MNNTKKYRSLWIAVFASLVLTACGTSDSPPPFGGGKTEADKAAEEAAFADAPDEVKSLYKTNCLSCHGGQLEGKIGESTNLQKVGERRTRDEIVQKIQTGGRGMPAMSSKLKPEEIDLLADWLSGKK